MTASILVVDDSPHLHKLVRAALYGEPLEIHSVDGGEEAVVTAASLRPELILLDVDMPAMDGFEVCRRLKANPRTALTPILFLTADIALADKVKALDLGATGYITKPFKADDLRARVHTALRTRGDIQNVTMRDDLTHLWNRRYLDLHLPAHLSMARRTDQPLTCVMADIDGLGTINRLHGSAMGDEVIRKTAEVFSGQGRVHDTFCYLGDGKFVALLPGTNRSGATHLADRARAQIEQQLKRQEGAEVHVTCSFGVADTQAEGNVSLLDGAEVATYLAKQSGRNRVAVGRLTPVNACAA